MFGLLDLSENSRGISLKCNPGRAIELREQYKDIQPGYHMNKTQWNSVYFTGGLPREMVLELIDHSFELVVQGLKKKDREVLDALI